MAQRRFLVTTILLICCLALIGCVTGIGADQQGNPVSQINELGQLTVSFIDVGQGTLYLSNFFRAEHVNRWEKGIREKLVSICRNRYRSNRCNGGHYPHSDHIRVLLQYENFQVENLSAQSDPLFNIQRFADSYKNQGLKINTAQAGAAIPIEA